MEDPTKFMLVHFYTYKKLQGSANANKPQKKNFLKNQLLKAAECLTLYLNGYI